MAVLAVLVAARAASTICWERGLAIRSVWGIGGTFRGIFQVWRARDAVECEKSDSTGKDYTAPNYTSIWTG